MIASQSNLWGKGLCLTLGDGTDADTVASLFQWLNAKLYVRLTLDDGMRHEVKVLDAVASEDVDGCCALCVVDCDARGEVTGEPRLVSWASVAGIHIY